MNGSAILHSVCWCCTSCGFLLEGGQPHMECPICEAYKESFVDTPAHVELEIRARFADGPNSAEARAERLAKLQAGGYLKKFRLKGRFNEVVHRPGESRKYWE